MKITMATACVRGGAEYPRVRGVVRFFNRGDGVLVEAAIEGLPQTETGFFGFHIHSGRGCGGEGFADTRSHFDPLGAAHPKHAGDLPPLLADAGRAYMRVLTRRFRLEDVVGRTVVIHDKADDFCTQPAGNAGTKIACGVIRRCM